MKYTRLVLICFLVLTTSCATVYKPTNNALKIKSDLSHSQALKFFKSFFISNNKAAGLCKGLGIDGQFGAPTWFLNHKQSALKVTKAGFGFNASRQKFGYSMDAYGTSSISSVSYSDIKKKYKFTEIKSVLLKQSGNMLACPSVKGHTEIVLFVSTGLGHAVIFQVPNSLTDRFIASMMVLVPDITLETK